YTITVTVAPAPAASDASLSDLTLSTATATGTATLAPDFASDTLEYTVSIANALSSLTLTPTSTDSNANIVISATAADGSDLTVDASSGEVSGLSEGDNTIGIAVTAEDGTTVRTYTVTVTRLSLPAAPRNLVIDTIAYNSLTFSWQAPENSDAVGITGYRIERAADVSGSAGAFTELVADTGTTSLVYTDSTVLELNTYYYRVTALSFAAIGEPSAALSATTPVRPLDDFITVWRMTSADRLLTFPSMDSSYTIDWGDGTIENITSNNPIHTYTTAGDYTVTAENDITRFNLDNGADKEKLIEIQQWGTANWTTMARAFYGASNMTMTANDTPNLAGVTNTANMFRDASAFNGDISDWNVASVTTMFRMFDGASVFNQDIGSWNVASITQMTGIFEAATAFNQDIGNWNVASVTNMTDMFNGASIFNGDIGNWNVANVTNMANMFRNAGAFNQNIGNWNVASVTNMLQMFVNTTAFNGDISGWNVASVTDMEAMFANARAFNQDIGGWNVASVTAMQEIFDGATVFNQNLGRWYVDETVADLQTANSNYDGVNDLNVLDFNFVAQNAFLLGQSTSYALATGADAEGSDNARFTLTSDTLSFRSGEAANGTYTVRIAQGGGFGTNNSIDLTFDVTGTVTPAAASDASLSDLALSAGTLTPAFASDTLAYTVSVANTVTSLSVTPTSTDSNANFVISGTAADGTALTVDTSGQVSGLTEGDNTISITVTAQDTVQTYTITVTVASATPTVTNTDDFITVWRIPADDLELRFPSLGRNVYTIDWGDGTIEEVTDSNPTHTYGAAGDYTVTATNTITRFYLNNNAENRAKLTDIQQWGTANWPNMDAAFSGASNMTMSATDSPNLAGLTNMVSMFRDASAFNGNIGNWNVASVTNMGTMFLGASAFNQNIGNWNVASVGDMANMFQNAILFNQDISGWNVASVRDMTHMFSASAFNQNIGSWNVGSVTGMSNMFRNASAFNQNIGSWNIASVTTMSNMFNGASAFNQDISGWNVAGVTNMFNMFNGADAFNQNLGRWYVDETVDDLQTANSDYDGVNDLNVLNFNFVAQNTVLSGQSPTYTLATGAGTEGTDNARFTLTSNTLSFNSGEAADGTYTVRITVGGDAVFGTSNSIDLTVVVGELVADASLSDLTLSEGTLAPDFASDTTDYTVSVDNAVSSLTVTPTSTDSNASFAISATATDGTDLTIDSNEVSGLTEGDNTINIAVTAADDTTIATYTITVTVASAPAADDTDFITVWRMPADGLTLTFPSEGNYTIDWGDGTIEEVTDSNPPHTYEAAGDYIVTATN
ncbi:MAG: BspA family leucine-rich repeat surface protein, partial [Methylococcales symbiont of Iophon sp. n. MRB-2018]